MNKARIVPGWTRRIVRMTVHLPKKQLFRFLKQFGKNFALDSATDKKVYLRPAESYRQPMSYDDKDAEIVVELDPNEVRAFKRFVRNFK